MVPVVWQVSRLKALNLDCRVGLLKDPGVILGWWQGQWSGKEPLTGADRRAFGLVLTLHQACTPP